MKAKSSNVDGKESALMSLRSFYSMYLGQCVRGNSPEILNSLQIVLLSELI